MVNTSTRILNSSNNYTISEECADLLETIGQGHITEPLYAQVLAAATLVAITLLTFVNNLVVLVALTLGRGRPMTFSLSMTLTISLVTADLLLSMTVMPVGVYNIVGESWIMGKAVCRLHMAIDILLCTTSILHLTGLSFDRYLAICRPFLHRRVTKSWARALSVSLWLVSFLIAFPVLVPDWHHQGVDNVLAAQCVLELYESGRTCVWLVSPIYQSVVIPLSFFVPLALIIGFHVSICVTVTVTTQRRRLRGLSPFEGQGSCSPFRAESVAGIPTGRGGLAQAQDSGGRTHLHRERSNSFPETPQESPRDIARKEPRTSDDSPVNKFGISWAVSDRCVMNPQHCPSSGGESMGSMNPYKRDISVAKRLKSHGQIGFSGYRKGCSLSCLNHYRKNGHTRPDQGRQNETSYTICIGGLGQLPSSSYAPALFQRQPLNVKSLGIIAGTDDEDENGRFLSKACSLCSMTSMKDIHTKRTKVSFAAKNIDGVFETGEKRETSQDGEDSLIDGLDEATQLKLLQKRWLNQAVQQYANLGSHADYVRQSRRKLIEHKAKKQINNVDESYCPECDGNEFYCPDGYLDQRNKTLKRRPRRLKSIVAGLEDDEDDANSVHFTSKRCKCKLKYFHSHSADGAEDLKTDQQQSATLRCQKRYTFHTLDVEGLRAEIAENDGRFLAESIPIIVDGRGKVATLDTDNGVKENAFKRRSEKHNTRSEKCTPERVNGSDKCSPGSDRFITGSRQKTTEKEKPEKSENVPSPHWKMTTFQDISMADLEKMHPRSQPCSPIVTRPSFDKRRASLPRLYSAENDYRNTDKCDGRAQICETDHSNHSSLPILCILPYVLSTEIFSPTKPTHSMQAPGNTNADVKMNYGCRRGVSPSSSLRARDRRVPCMGVSSRLFDYANDNEHSNACIPAQSKLDIFNDVVSITHQELSLRFEDSMPRTQDCTTAKQSQCGAVVTGNRNGSNCFHAPRDVVLASGKNETGEIKETIAIAIIENSGPRANNVAENIRLCSDVSTNQASKLVRPTDSSAMSSTHMSELSSLAESDDMMCHFGKGSASAVSLRPKSPHLHRHVKYQIEPFDMPSTRSVTEDIDSYSSPKQDSRSKESRIQWETSYCDQQSARESRGTCDVFTRPFKSKKKEERELYPRIARRSVKGLFDNRIYQVNHRSCQTPLSSHFIHGHASLSKKREDNRAIKTVVALVLLFVVCWLPLFTVLLVQSHVGYDVPLNVVTTFTWLGYVNSAINPLLYYRCNRSIRVAIRRLFGLKIAPKDHSFSLWRS